MRAERFFHERAAAALALGEQSRELGDRR